MTPTHRARASAELLAAAGPPPVNSHVPELADAQQAVERERAAAQNPATVHQLLLTAQANADSVAATLARLERLLDHRPARLIPISLSATTPRVRDSIQRPSQSIALLNPSPVAVFFDVFGGRADAVPSVPSIPAGSGICLPVAVGDVEIGADPAGLAAGDAVLFLMRFEVVQAFYFWRA